MINEIILMNNYGLYVWTAFLFTLSSFSFLYVITKTQLEKEKKKFEDKFIKLSTEKANLAKQQTTYRDILLTSLLS